MPQDDEVRGINADLALELLALTHTAQFQDSAAMTASAVVTQMLLPGSTTATLNGQTVRNATFIKGTTGRSDTECFVARSDGGEVVVAFRGSETAFFNESGAFKDWVLTDFRSTRIPYPPDRGNLLDPRYVHEGFWRAYEQIRPVLLSEVSRQAAKSSKAKSIVVTGFSLGGALALLASLDIADGMRGTPVDLFTFAAPRAGDGSLNKLLAERVRKSTLIAYRGDPVVHLPPLGPNFPINFRNPVYVDIGSFHVGLGTPLNVQVGQQYRTADRLIWIDKLNEMHEDFPTAQVALNFLDHDWPPYMRALRAIRRRQRAERDAKAAAPRHGHTEAAVLHTLLASPH
jgi:hypothetical protein